MQSFDHETAWTEVAKPAFDALPADVHALFARVIAETADLNQTKSLLMPWPDTDLRAAFELLGDEPLATASRVIHDYGHWGSGISRATTGAHWKFSNYADQVLRARLDVRCDEEPRGISIRIHEGLLCVCVSTPESWRTTEVGIATRLTLDAINRTPRPLDPRADGSSKFVSREQWDAFIDAAVAWATRLRTEHDEVVATERPLLAKLLRAAETYMVDEKVLKERSQAQSDHVSETKARERDPKLSKFAHAMHAIADALPERDAGRVLYQLTLEVRLTAQTRSVLLDALADKHPALVEMFRKQYEPHLVKAY